MSIGRLSVVAIDCPDPPVLARFYSEITGWAIDDGEGDWVQLRNDGRRDARLSARRRPPPAGVARQRATRSRSISISTWTISTAAEQQVLELGARKAEVQPGKSFTVFLDPAGHPFCLVAADD